MSQHFISSRLDVPGASLYYEKRGAGPLLVIIPGGPQDAGVFADLADLLAELNPRSEEVLDGCLVEPALAVLPVGQTVQFERLGYFCVDTDSRPGAPVFNRTVTLKDTWAKVQATG